MTDVSALLKELSGPGDRGDRVKVAIDRAAHLAGLSYWRCFDLWYRKANPNEDERNAILAALVDAKIREERNELHCLRLAHARLESRLNQMEQALRGAVAGCDGRTIEAVFGAITARG